MSDKLVSALDWDAVALAIRAEESHLKDWDYEDAAQCVWNYATRVLPVDLNRYVECLGVEQYWVAHVYEDICRKGEPECTISIGEQPRTDSLLATRAVHGYTDAVFLRADGTKEVKDWKTASSLGTDWINQMEDSWQWRLYCWVYGAKRFRYVGVDKGSLGEKTPGHAYNWGGANMKELTCTPGPDNSAHVISQLLSVLRSRNALWAYSPTFWPRNMPLACTPYYGAKCAHWDICRGKVPGPQEPYTKVSPLSYSGMMRFLRCPEHYRLNKLLNISEPSHAADFGKAVHRGLAVIYSQFNDLKTKGF